VSQVNLLPPELRQRQKVRRTTSLVAVAGVGVIALIGAFWFIQGQRLADVEDQLAAQETRNAELQGQIDELRPFADLQAELAAKEALVGTLFQNEVAWSSALLDVSRVIPDLSYLTNMTGTVAPGGQSGGTPDTTLIGSMSFVGVALETDTIATWLTRLEQVEGWVNAWVTSAQEDAPLSQIYGFSSGLDLTVEAATERGRGGVVQP
jgi:Tfp pilus assembly protein PilN